MIFPFFMIFILAFFPIIPFFHFPFFFHFAHVSDFPFTKEIKCVVSFFILEKSENSTIFFCEKAICGASELYPSSKSLLFYFVSSFVVSISVFTLTALANCHWFLFLLCENTTSEQHFLVMS